MRRNVGGGMAKTLGLLACLALAGCGPSNPLDERVSARTSLDYTMWRTRIADRLQAAEKEELDAMVEEVRLGIMVGGKASGSDAINDALRQEIDGRTVREVLADGCGKKWQRLDLEKRRMDELIERDSHLRFKEGDTESRAFVDEQVGKMKLRSAEIALELQTVERRLTELGVTRRPEPIPEPKGTVAPAPVVEEPDEAPQRLPTTN